MANKRGNPNIAKLGKNTQFGNGQPTNKGGRPKKIYTILRETGYSISDIRTIFQQIAFYSYDELKKMFSAEKNYKHLPTIMVTVGKFYLKCAKEGDFKELVSVMNFLLPSANTYLQVHKGEREEVEQTETIGTVLVYNTDKLEIRKQLAEKEYQEYKRRLESKINE